jgi:dihydrofolate synthase/folylpolyglutamate synthase
MNPHQYINELDKYGTDDGFKPGLDRIKALLAPFASPENTIPAIHVAGSNGKGSTITFLKNIYQQAGYKVGSYISPHLLKLNERFEINGSLITDDKLEEMVDMLLSLGDLLKPDIR